VRLIQVDAESIPNFAEFKPTLLRCQRAAAGESEKARIFFDRAAELVSQRKIPILQIADFNTTGVKGPCQNGTPYFAFLKAPGQSKKSGETQLGTFGIGKYAPFVVSRLRTIFISTVWSDGTCWHHYVQGKSILMSHYDEQGCTRKGVGYWGVKNRCLPLIGLDPALPDWLLRTNRKEDLPKVAGTTVSILGFDAVTGWQRMLAAAIAENFFGAFARGQLEVDINGMFQINRHTIDSIFLDQEIRESISDMKGEPDKFENSGLFLETLSSTSDVIVEHTENLHLGNCQLRIIVGEDLPKKIAVLRDGMLITQDLERLRRFSEFKGFVAVLECQSSKGKALLRNMEPPKHDDFEPDRLPTKKDQQKGRLALREIAAWVREMLKRYAQDPVSEVTSVDELKEFFADEAEHGTDGREREENPSGNVIIRARPLRKKDRPEMYQPQNGADEEAGTGEDGEGEGAGEGEGHAEEGADYGGNGSGSGTGSDRAEGRGGTQAQKNTAPRVKLSDVRCIPVTPRLRRVAFTPDYSGEIKVSVQDSGADANYALKVVSCNHGSVSRGLIEHISVTVGRRCMIDVELERDFDGAMRVIADAI
jgi:hypothetical protein